MQQQSLLASSYQQAKDELATGQGSLEASRALLETEVHQKRAQLEAEYTAAQAELAAREQTLAATAHAAEMLLENKHQVGAAHLQSHAEMAKAQVAEAEKQRVEAEGKAAANRILSASITNMILKEKGIEATRELANSPNAKVIVVGSGKDGLPIILGGQ